MHRLEPEQLRALHNHRGGSASARRRGRGAGAAGARISASGSGARCAKITARTAMPGTISPTITRARAPTVGARTASLGFCDEHRLCFAPAFWNGNDPILKERLFGLTNGEGNHGEDVKELYYYLDGTPTHSYMRALYKYPQAAFPYEDLVARERAAQRKQEPRVRDHRHRLFDENRYFDVTVEYAKHGPDDILMRITVDQPRAGGRRRSHVLPTLWFRNTWSWGDG